MLALALLIPAVALGARFAKVDDDNVVVYQGPSEKSDILAKVKKGTRLYASNLPTEGYYKVRTAAGVVGWIKADVLELEPVPGKGGGPAEEDPR